MIDLANQIRVELRLLRILLDQQNVIDGALGVIQSRLGRFLIGFLVFTAFLAAARVVLSSGIQKSTGDTDDLRRLGQALAKLRRRSFSLRILILKQIHVEFEEINLAFELHDLGLARGDQGFGVLANDFELVLELLFADSNLADIRPNSFLQALNLISGLSNLDSNTRALSDLVRL